MTIEFDCPRCAKLLRTSDDKAGVRAKCPHCGGSIEIPIPQAEELFEDDFDSEPDDPSLAADTGSTERFCRSCGEPADDGDSKCGFCGAKLPVAREAPRRAPPARRPVRTLNPTDIMSRAFRIVAAQLGLCVAAVWLPYFILAAGATILQAVLQAVLAFVLANGLPIGPAVAVMLPITVLVLLEIFSSFLMPGQTLVMLRLARGERAEIADLFKAGPFVSRMLGATVIETLIQWSVVAMVAIPTAVLAASFQRRPDIVMIIVLSGFAVGILAWCFLALSSWPFRYVLVDHDPPGLRCIGMAFQLTRGHRMMTVALTMLAGLIALSGYLMMCVGIFFTVPLAWMMFAVAYCDMSGQRTAGV